MKILIVENEIYLAQSIASKLLENGYNCEIAASAKDAIKDEFFDVVLLSTSTGAQNFMPVIDRYKKSIIILMVNYINNDTVSIPLKAGAKDYILKPFMIEELIKKINHYLDYERLLKENDSLKKYLLSSFSSSTLPDIPKKTELPKALYSSSQKKMDAYAFKLAAVKGMRLEFLSLQRDFDEKFFTEHDNKSIIYAVHFESLKKSDKKLFLEVIASKNVVFSSTEPIDDESIEVVELESDEGFVGSKEIFTIEDYVKNILIAFQDKYPDVELSKKLGISRKSLWEKRKKHGIYKKK
ncbi:MAG: response regulator [Campylobacteraceae bacterium]|nr:response regulator [Campylobacteraceae bacterium]